MLGDSGRASSWLESNVVYGTASSSFSRIRGGSRTWGEKTEDIEPGQTEACPRKAAMTGSLFNIERVLTPGHHEWRRNDVIPGAFPLQRSSFHMARRIIPKLI
ncbi:protein of unknown function [Pseudomonas inefficax]|uniref:Uncharacterized protein n=1 Tax=Pseudomonas inefficax TaxID=2078786 RepID=A0AAQ1PGA8_9PSED|nr:protein of unknown function [Pseudomonas inefficax]